MYYYVKKVKDGDINLLRKKAKKVTWYDLLPVLATGEFFMHFDI